MKLVTQLIEFRQAIYKNLCKAQDATFELMDALLLTRTAQSLADLSSGGDNRPQTIAGRMFSGLNLLKKVGAY